MPSMRIALTLAALTAAALPGAAGAEPLVISGPNPFLAGCSTPQMVEGFEVEPTLAVSPKDPSLVVAAWQQDRANQQGALTNVVGISRDAGATWERVELPDLVACDDGSLSNASDPWVTFGGDGTLYIASLVLAFPTSIPTGKIVVHRSADEGRTWDKRVLDGPGPLVDKEVLAASPTDPKTVSAVWTKPSAKGGLMMFSATHDGGASWSRPRAVAIQRRNGIGAPAIADLGRGRLLATGAVAGPDSIARFYAWRSSDGGRRWHARIGLGSVVLGAGEGFTEVDPDESGAPDVVRAPLGFGQLASSPDGTAYFAHPVPEDRPGANLVRLLRSTDGGRTFRQMPFPFRRDAFTPVLAAGPGGQVAVSAYVIDAGGGRSSTLPLRAHSTLVVSHDRGRHFASTQLTPSFDFRATETARGYFLGDYTGLAPDGRGGFAAAITVGAPLALDGPTDIGFVDVRGASAAR